MKTPQEEADKIWNEYVSHYSGMSETKQYIFVKTESLKRVERRMKRSKKGSINQEFCKQVKKCINLM